MTAWCKESELMTDDEPWYKVKWSRVEVIENEDVQMTWDFEYQMRKESPARRLEVTKNRSESKWLVPVRRINEKMNVKRQKYEQLAF